MEEIYRTPTGERITVQAMWGGARVVGHLDTYCRIGKTQYASYEEALQDLRANSTRVR